MESKKEKSKKRKDEKPVTVHITNHNKFEKGVGAFITNLNHLTIVMDGEGNMKLDASQVPGVTSAVNHEQPAEPVADSPDRIIRCILKLKEEKVLKRLFDYTWVMEVMNQTKDLPKFNTPTSFITYLKNHGIERVPSEDTIEKKQNKLSGTFPNWEFTDCDTTEAMRRINVAKRFLVLLRNE
jgi:hypothetical protein